MFLVKVPKKAVIAWCKQNQITSHLERHVDYKSIDIIETVDNKLYVRGFCTLIHNKEERVITTMDQLNQLLTLHKLGMFLQADALLNLPRNGDIQ
jgi:NADPH-dependent 7-cyano-7-deazaguanine reductase QueF-like protein